MKEKIKILLAEDDENLGIVLKDFLELKDFYVDLVKDGIEAMHHFECNKFNLCILDVMMPRLDGFSVARKIRKTDKVIPLIFLTAKSLQMDKLEGLKIGADDYITKPFNTEELILRINAILKRVENPSAKQIKSNELKIGAFYFNIDERLLVRNKKVQKLTTKEAALLQILTENANELVERNSALIAIWGNNSYFNSRSMDVYVTKLRRYLAPDKSISILNVHGEGFKLIC